jgi:phospholipid/cholesterol/gamma-HCH transport system substrate-binding protein
MGPEFRAALTELQGTLAQSTQTLDAFEGTLRSTDSLLNNEGQSLARELRETMQSAQQAANALEATLQDARPATRELAQTTLPLANATLQDLKRTSAALRAVTERIETEGAGSLVGGSKLPDYEP